MRPVLISLFLLLTVSSCDTLNLGSLGSLAPLDLNGTTWEINSEQGNVRPACITFADNKVSRLGDCDGTDVITDFSYNPGPTISVSNEVVLVYRVNADPAEPTTLFDLVLALDGKLRGVMVVYRNSVTTIDTTYTNMVLTKQ
jgi:hypothetical protein